MASPDASPAPSEPDQRLEPDATAASAGYGLSDTWPGTLRRATEILSQAGCDTARLDAELLLAAALRTTRTGLYVMPKAPLAAAAFARFDELIGRRACREPVAYILGEKPFRRITLTVDPRVLIPRPETELLVEAAALDIPTGARVADVGTGSGAIALALKDERPDVHVVGIDSSVDALAVARDNAARQGLDVMFRIGDLLTGFRPGQFDAVIANLPYVPDGTALQPEIERYEPAAALFAGPDGLDVIARLCGQLLGTDYVALEHGEDQGQAVQDMIITAGFSSVRRLHDLAGHERVVVGQR
jgi:release factor glutamine methyltransferase